MADQWQEGVHATARDDGPVAIPIGQMSTLEDLLDQLEEMIRDARSMPLSASALVDRSEVLQIVETLKRSIPEEVARARAVIRDRDELLDRAQSEAERLVARAKEARDRMVERSEIVQNASREAERILAEAERQARQMRLDAEAYVDGKLASFEIALHKVLGAVERGRSRLGGAREADQLAPEDETEA